jgi:hypothetical protein
VEFLKAILGDELFAQVEQAVNAHNGKPENKISIHAPRERCDTGKDWFLLRTQDFNPRTP